MNKSRQEGNADDPSFPPKKWTMTELYNGIAFIPRQLIANFLITE